MPVKKWWRSARISCTRDKSLTRQKRSPMRSFNLSALAVRERAITLFFIFAAACAGIYAYFHLGRGEDPSFTIKVLTVTTVWPGATAQVFLFLMRRPPGSTLFPYTTASPELFM